MNKILVLIGPTASGKSELAVKLAKKFNGEIISCDSRQIYRGMDLGTGKVTGNWQPVPIAGHPERVHPSEGSPKKNSQFIYKSIPHHLIDFINPARRYSVSLFQKQAQKVIKDILKRGKLPILCGGTAHWADAVIYNQYLPEVKPNLKLRASLEKKSVGELYKQLQKLDPTRAKTIDAKNPRRLIRALEIVMTTGKPVPLHPTDLSPYHPLWLGIKTDQEKLYKKIDKRLKERLKLGMIKEVENLHKGSPVKPKTSHLKTTSKLSWSKLESFGLEYKFVSLFLQKKISYDEMFNQLSYAIKHYSKRQLTWWKRNNEIKWIEPDAKEATKKVSAFLNPKS